MATDIEKYSRARLSETEPASGLADTWRQLALPGLLFLGLLVALYWTVIGNLVRQWWTDDNYSHGFLVPLFSAYLICQRRTSLAAVLMEGHWVGWPIFAS